MATEESTKLYAIHFVVNYTRERQRQRQRRRRQQKGKKEISRNRFERTFFFRLFFFFWFDPFFSLTRLWNLSDRSSSDANEYSAAVQPPAIRLSYAPRVRRSRMGIGSTRSKRKHHTATKGSHNGIRYRSEVMEGRKVFMRDKKKEKERKRWEM